MAVFAPRTVRVLDLLVLLVAGILGLTAVFLIINDQPARALSVVACLAVFFLLWVVRRRHPQASWISWAVLALGSVTIFFADGVPSMPLVLFGTMLVVLDFGPRRALAGVAAGCVVTSVGAVIVYQAPFVAAALDGVAGVLLQLVGYCFGLMLREADQQTRAKAEALWQRDALNVALVEANQRLRDSIEMEKELILADERARAARELHDGLGHRLAVVRMSLEFAEQAHSSDPERAFEETARAREGLEGAIDEMRIWVRALNPVRAEHGTRTGLKAVAESFESTGMRVGFDSAGEEFPLTDAATLYCYRFVQEGLTNGLRHARSQDVGIRVEYRRPSVVLAVSSGGAGADSAQVSEGFGLRSLRERAAAIGGTFHAGVQDGRFVIGAVVLDAANASAPSAIQVVEVTPLPEPVDLAGQAVPQTA